MAKSQSRKKSQRKRMKQRLINMVGCSKSHKHNNSCSGCSKCGPNCHCGPNCNCPHNCPGNCYLNRRMKAGAGCGSTGCPVGGLTGGSLSNNPPGFPYEPWTFSKLGGIENTGYLNNSSTIGGYIYKGKHHSKKHSKSFTKGKSKLRSSRTFKHYKYNGGGLIPTDINNLFSGIKYNFQTASNALSGYKPPVDPTVYKGQLETKTRLYI